MQIVIHIKNNRYQENLSFFGTLLSSELKINDIYFYTNFGLNTKLMHNSTHYNNYGKLLWFQYEYYK